MKYLPQYLLKACSMYWLNRKKGNELYAATGKSGWDKEADLDYVAVCAKRANLYWSACVGTFWFNRYTKNYVITYEISEEEGIITTRKPREKKA